MFPLWAIVLGGSSAALSRAGIRQGDTRVTALASRFYYVRKAGEESGCVWSEGGHAHFLSLTSQSALDITASSLCSQGYVYFTNRAVLTVVPAALRLQGTAASLSQAEPPTGAAAVGVLGQEIHLYSPSVAREAFPRGDTKG